MNANRLELNLDSEGDPMLARLAKVFLLISLTLTCLATVAAAQSIKVKSLRINPDGQLVWNAGETLSKQGISVRFETHMEAGKFAGYKLANADITAWKSGDRVLLYIRGIKYTGGFGKYHDPSGAKVFGDEAGGFREVTLDSVKRTGDRVVVGFLEEIELADGRKVKQLELPVVEGFLLPTVPPGAPAEKKR